ncbi:hypothetical protein RRG08_050537 [Elysia crispata]|uniref:Cholecystokinin n=1 Tax=Elysia crispata TaxID=231223 RepID=A0AAE0ZUL5_9GAST|nr:hypothetical protein RRG08_050537 [Elysia crispata]
MESQIFGLLFIVTVCACSCSCASLQANSRRQEDIQHLVSLLGKLKNIERVRQQHHHHSQHHPKQQQHQLLSGVSLTSRHSPSSSSDYVPAEDKAALMRSVADLTSGDVTNSLLLGQDDLDLDLADDSAAAQLLSGSGSDGSGNNGEKSKRQGAWSYDYGLGGGRFGKRNFDDYGMGGGRWGRDVDHVDISDTSNADASTL